MNAGLDILSLTSPCDALACLGSWLRTERQRANWTQGEIRRKKTSTDWLAKSG